MRKVSWFLVLLMLAIVPALAVIIPEEIKGYDPNYIQIDGDVNPSTGDCLGFLPCSDWDTPNLANLGHLLPDTIGNDDEDILSPDSVLNPGSSLPKQDITRIWLSNNKDYFYLAEERRANNGTSGWHVFVTHLKPAWSQGQVVAFDFCNYDMEILICFPKGGSPEDASISVKRIYDKNLPPQALMYPGVMAGDIWDLGVFNQQLPFPSPNDAILFKINGVEEWAINGAINSKGIATTTPPYKYPAACFAEAAISLGIDGMNVSPCGTKAYVTVITRSSCTLNSDLKDISYPVLYNFGGPDLEVDPPETTCTNLTRFSATASGGIAPYTFEWYDNGNLLRTSDPINDEPATDSFEADLQAGNHVVHVVVTDSADCSDSADTDPFTVYDPLRLVLTKPIVPDCTNKADLSATADGGAPSYRFQWYDNDGAPFRDVTQAGVTDTIDDYEFTPGEHIIRVVVTDSRTELACSAEDSYGPFTVYELLTLDLQPIAPNCENKADLSATADGGAPSYRFQWYDNDGAPFRDVTQAGATDTIDDYEFAPGINHTIKVVVTDSRTALACSEEDAEGPFMVYDPLDVEIIPGEPSCDGIVTFTANPSGGLALYTYQWEEKVGDVVVGTGTESTYQYKYKPETDCPDHTLCVKVTDSRDPACDDSACKTISQHLDTSIF